MSVLSNIDKILEKLRLGQFPRIAGNAGNYRKFHESHETLNQI